MQAGMFDFFKENELTDVTLLVQGRKYQCHKLVLSVGSEYFRTMFTSRFQEASQNEIELRDINASAFESVLQYIYSGKVEITAENVEQLLNIACMMHLAALKSACCKLYKSFMSLDNVIEHINVAEKFSAEELTHACAELLVKNFKRVKGTFNSLPIDALSIVLNHNSLPVDSEKEVATAVLQWLKANDADAASVEKLVPAIRLTELDPFYVNFTLLQSDVIRKSCKVANMLQTFCNRANFGLSLPREIAIKFPRPSSGVQIEVCNIFTYNFQQPATRIQYIKFKFTAADSV